MSAIAHRWASGRGGGKPADDAATGSAAAAIAAIEARRAGVRPADEIEIDEAQFAAVRLFFRLAGQWRLHPVTGTRLALDPVAIRPTAELMDIAVTTDLFDDLSTMERAALAAWTA